MPGAKIRGSNRSWRCYPADFENEGSTARNSTSHHSLYHVSLLPWNFKHGEVSTRKNKSPCRCEQLPSLLPCPPDPHSSVGGHMASLGLPWRRSQILLLSDYTGWLTQLLPLTQRELDAILWCRTAEKGAHFLPQNGSPLGSLRQRSL